MNSSNNPNNFSEQEFDRFLRDIDDLYGDAPGLTVPANFVARAVAKAQAGSAVSMERRSKWNWHGWSWFWDFSMPVQLAALSVLLLASLGGIRAGVVITDLIIANRKTEPVIHPDMAPAEQSLVQLVRSEGLAVTGKANQKSGEPQ